MAERKLSSVNSQTVSTSNVDTSFLRLSGRQVEKISHDPNDKNPKYSVSSEALYKGLHQLDQKITELDPTKGNVFKDNSVVSLPVVSELPGESGWVFSTNYTVTPQNYLTYIGVGKGVEDRNSIVASPKYFRTVGNYFLVLNISRLDSGTVAVYDEDDRVLLSTTKRGRYYLEKKVTEANKNIASLRVSCSDAFYGDLITFNFMGLYYVWERIRDYIFYSMAALSGGTQIVTKEYVDEAIEDALKNIGTDEKLREEFERHLAASNPHNITCDKIGAAKLDHIHSEYVTKTQLSENNASLSSALKGYTDSEINDLKSELQSEFTSELDDAKTELTNKHNEDINNLQETLTNKITTSVDDLRTEQQNYTDLKTDAISDELEEHLKAHNPHNISCDMINAAPKNHRHQAYEIDGLAETILGGIKNITKLSVVDSNYVPCPQRKKDIYLSPNPIVLMSDRLIHSVKESFDYSSGYAFTSVLPDDENYIGEIFKTSFDSDPISFPKFTKKPNEEIILGYNYGEKRTLKKLTIYSKPNYGRIKSFSILDGEEVVFKRQNISWPENTFNLSFDIYDERGDNENQRFSTGKFKLRIDEVENLVQSKWTTHLDLFFCDVTKGDVFVSPFIDVSFGEKGNTKSATVDEANPVFLSIEDEKKIKNAVYYVYGRVDESSIIKSVKASPVPFEIGSECHGIDIFKDIYKSKITHPLFGDLSVSSKSTPINFLFDRDETKVFKSASGVDSTTITHDFKTEIGLKGISLRFPKEDRGKKIVSVDLKVYEYNEETETDDIVFKKVSSDIFIPLYLSKDEIESVYTLDLEEGVTCLGYKVHVENTSGDDVKIVNMEVFLSENFYSINKNSVENPEKEGRVFLGKITIKEIHGELVPVCRPFTNSAELYLPVNNLNVCDLKNYVIDNPFFDSEISIVAESNESGEMFGLPPLLEILQVTNNSIVVRAQTANTFRLKIVREWN